MSDGVIYIFTITLLIALAGLAFWIARQSFGFEGVKLFQSKPRRLGVVEMASVDGRRRLMLIRRDNVEHLIMTGGPVDIVVETGIPAHTLVTNGLGQPLTRPSHEVGESRHSFTSPETPLVLQRDPTA
jgi:flagellar protein FliO/FliZ